MKNRYGSPQVGMDPAKMILDAWLRALFEGKRRAAKFEKIARDESLGVLRGRQEPESTARRFCVEPLALREYRVAV